MAAHLACKRSAGFLHLRLDEAVARLPHEGLPAKLGDAIEEGLARFHVCDQRRPRLFLKTWNREDHEQLVAPDPAALTVDRPNAVAVTVECDAEIELFVRD